MLGYYSALDGSVQPIGVTIPESYDPAKPDRLYVWLHGRNNGLTEAGFINGFHNAPRFPNTAYTADVGQLTLDSYGRGNNANHQAGEVDIFEGIAAMDSRHLRPFQVRRWLLWNGLNCWRQRFRSRTRRLSPDGGAPIFMSESNRQWRRSVRVRGSRPIGNGSYGDRVERRARAQPHPAPPSLIDSALSSGLCSNGPDCLRCSLADDSTRIGVRLLCGFVVADAATIRANSAPIPRRSWGCGAGYHCRQPRRRLRVGPSRPRAPRQFWREQTLVIARIARR